MRRRAKYFLLVVLSLIFTVCSCLAIAGCKRKNETYGSEETIAPPAGDSVVERRVTVLTPDGDPLGRVEVQLFLADESEAYCGAKTGSDGVAILRAGEGLDFLIEIVNPPEGYEYSQRVELNSSDESKTVYLSIAGAGELSYSVTVKSEGGLLMDNISVVLHDGDTAISSGVTNKTGEVSLRVAARREYTITLAGVPEGYTPVGELKTSAEKDQTIVLKSAVMPASSIPSSKLYAMEDIMYDFTVITSDGDSFTLSEALKTKKLVLINFWASWCGPCRGEFDDMERVYDEYKEDVAIIALSTDDDINAVKKYKDAYKFKDDENDPNAEERGLTFGMAPDSVGLYSRFSRYSGGSIPVNVFIDRYGRISDIGKGGLSESVFRTEFAKYTAADYVQKKYTGADDAPVVEPDKPDVEMPSSEAISNAVNSANFEATYTGPSNEITWPWIIGSDNESIVPGNLGHHNTTATIRAKFSMQPGQFLAFDYRLNTEDIDGADYLYVYVGEGDGTVGETQLDALTRVSKNWVTKYVYTPLVAGDYTLRLSYVKDHSDSNLKGQEVVAIRDLRVVTEAEIKEKNASVNILRDASSDFEQPAQQTGSISYWKKHVEVALGDDGYYHVGSKTGPYLLANLTGGTHYTNASVAALISAGYFKRAGLEQVEAYFVGGTRDSASYVEDGKGYVWLADASAVQGYTLVDETLKSLLNQVAQNFYTTKNFDGNGTLSKYYTKDTWLEFCSYFDHYGAGKSIENPLLGLCNSAAIEASLDDGKKTKPNHVVIDQSLIPRGKVYKFDCTKTGAYRVYSDISSTMLSQTGGYIDISGSGANRGDDAMGNYNVYVTFREGNSYYISTAFSLPQDFGEFDFYIEYLNTSYDEFTYASDGSYFYSYNPDGSLNIDISRNHGVHAELGTDGYYHQVLSGNILDSGEHSYFWVDLRNSTNLFGSYTLEDMARGYYMNGNQKVTVVVDKTGRKFFDLTSFGDKDYSDDILAYAAQTETEGERAGMIKASKELVEIVSKALAHIEHDSKDSWFGVAYYYSHIGEYSPQKA